MISLKSIKKDCPRIEESHPRTDVPAEIAAASRHERSVGDRCLLSSAGEAGREDPHPLREDAGRFRARDAPRRRPPFADHGRQHSAETDVGQSRTGGSHARLTCRRHPVVDVEPLSAPPALDLVDPRIARPCSEAEHGRPNLVDHHQAAPSGRLQLRPFGFRNHYHAHGSGNGGELKTIAIRRQIGSDGTNLNDI